MAPQARVIPLEAECAMPGPGSYEDAEGMLPRIRGTVERQVKSKILNKVSEFIEVESFDDLSPSFGPQTVIRARLFLADDWGDIEGLRRALLGEAERALGRAMETLSRSVQESQKLDIERAIFAAEMKKAQASFRDSFQRSVEEFLAYDECAGRR